MRCTWLPIDRPPGADVIAVTGDLFAADDEPFSAGDILSDAWHRVTASVASDAATASVKARYVGAAMQGLPLHDSVTLTLQPEAGRLLVNDVIVDVVEGTGVPAAFTARLSIVRSLFDLGTWQVPLTGAVPPDGSGLPFVVYLPHSASPSTSWPPAINDVSAWLLWGAVRPA